MDFNLLFLSLIAGGLDPSDPSFRRLFGLAILIMVALGVGIFGFLMFHGKR